MQGTCGDMIQPASMPGNNHQGNDLEPLTGRGYWLRATDRRCRARHEQYQAVENNKQSVSCARAVEVERALWPGGTTDVLGGATKQISRASANRYASMYSTSRLGCVLCKDHHVYVGQSVRRLNSKGMEAKVRQATPAWACRTKCLMHVSSNAETVEATCRHSADPLVPWSACWEAASKNINFEVLERCRRVFDREMCPSK